MRRNLLLRSSRTPLSKQPSKQPVKTDSRGDKYIFKTQDPFRNYIENKRVCVIGPSPILENRKLGWDFEEYDIICKTAGSMWIDGKNYYEDYARRIDVLYVNSQFSRFVTPDLDRFLSHGTKFFRMKYPASAWDSAAKQISAHVDNINYAAIELKKNSVRFPTLGVIAIQDLILQNPKELHITGFDFYVSRNYPDGYWQTRDITEYINGYITEEFQDSYKKTYGESKTHYKDTSDIHDHYFNSLFIKKLLNQNLVTMSDFTKKALDESLKKFKP